MKNLIEWYKKERISGNLKPIDMIIEKPISLILYKHQDFPNKIIVALAINGLLTNVFMIPKK